MPDACLPAASSASPLTRRSRRRLQLLGASVGAAFAGLDALPAAAAAPAAAEAAVAEPAPAGQEAGAVLAVAFDPVQWPITADRLHQVAVTYGAVRKVRVAPDSATALVLYADAAAAKVAADKLQGFAFYGDGHNVVGAGAAPIPPPMAASR